MTWELALQSLILGMAAIGSWFIYDLISEFKTFKESTRTDVQALKQERAGFAAIVQTAELNIGMRVNEMQKLHNDFTLEVKTSLMQFGHNTKNFEKFMQKSLDVCTRLSERLKMQEMELRAIKIEIGEVMIFKNRLEDLSKKK